MNYTGTKRRRRGERESASLVGGVGRSLMQWILAVKLLSEAIHLTEFAISSNTALSHLRVPEMIMVSFVMHVQGGA